MVIDGVRESRPTVTYCSLRWTMGLQTPEWPCSRTSNG